MSDDMNTVPAQPTDQVPAAEAPYVPYAPVEPAAAPAPAAHHHPWQLIVAVTVGALIVLAGAGLALGGMHRALAERGFRRGYATACAQRGQFRRGNDRFQRGYRFGGRGGI